MASDDKPLIVTIGNCQSSLVGKFLASLPEISRDYQIVRLERAARDLTPDKNWRKRLELFINANRHRLVAILNQQSHDWSGVRLTQDDVGPGVEIIRFPVMLLSYLWPLMTSYQFQRMSGHKRLLFRNTICDDLVLRLRARGVPRERLVEAYFEVDVIKKYRVDRLREINAAKCRQIDAVSDFGVWHEIEQHLPSHQLFRTANHPTGRLFSWFVEQITDRLKFITDRAFLRMRLDQFQRSFRVGDDEAPIHPQVARHFDLKWAFDARFRFWHEGSYTFEEWLYRLYDEYYDEGLVAAKEAWRERRLDEAARLFSEFAARNPDNADLRLSQASALMAVKEYDRAIVALKAAFDLEPAPNTVEKIFMSLSRRGRQDEAMEFLDGLGPTLKSDAVILLCRASAARERGDRDLSKSLLEQAEAANPFEYRVELARAEEADYERRTADAHSHMSRAHYLSNWSPAVETRRRAMVSRQAVRQQADQRQAARKLASQRVKAEAPESGRAD